MIYNSSNGSCTATYDTRNSVKIGINGKTLWGVFIVFADFNGIFIALANCFNVNSAYEMLNKM